MKNNTKIILAFISGICISVLISVTASTIINSKDVFFDNSESNLLLADINNPNVQDAIDATYTKTKSLSDRVSALEENENINILDKIYPIGSIYISVELSSPEDVSEKLGGTWEEYSQGKMLVGNDGVDYITNDTSKGSGGSSIATLTVQNIPNHTHTTPSTTISSSGAHTHSTTAKTITISSGLTAQSAGAHTHTPYVESASYPGYFAQYNKVGMPIGTHTVSSSSSGSIEIAGVKGSGIVSADAPNPVTLHTVTASAGAHTHNVTGSITIPALSVASSGAHTHTVPSLTTNTCTNCSGTSFSVQNPYTVVYMYKRVE